MKSFVKYDPLRGLPLVCGVLLIVLSVGTTVQAQSAMFETWPGTEQRTTGKLSGVLASIQQSYDLHTQSDQLTPFSSDLPGIQANATSIVIEAAADGDPAQLEADLVALGLQNPVRVGVVVSGRLPLSALSALDGLPSVRFVTAPIRWSHVGSVTSEADFSMAVDVARATYGVDGAGIKIGVISDSYNCLGGASADITSGDLPPTERITILKEGPCVNNIDEGRAMMQLIYDLAPGADLLFWSPESEADFAAGIRALRDAGADIIVDDLIFFAEAMWQDDLTAQAANEVAQGGVPYFSAFGNSGSTAYEAPFRNSGQVIEIDGTRYIPHDFDPGPNLDLYQEITLAPGQQSIFVTQWDDPHFTANGSRGATSDLDMLFFALDGEYLGGGELNLNGDAVEVSGLTNTGFSTDSANMMIAKYAGTSAAPLNLPDPNFVKYINFGQAQFIEYLSTNWTSYGHAATTNVAGVAASYYQQTPFYGVNPPRPESFTSLGGMPLLFDASGLRLASPLYVQQPRFTATDGTNTTFFPPFPGSDRDADGRPNFSGTSAAAPHAAAVGALIQQCDPNISVPQLYAAMESTAIDMNTLDFDYLTGYGLIQADGALRALGAEMDVLGKGITIDNNDFTPSTGDGTDFGSVPLFGGSLYETFRIERVDENCIPLMLDGSPTIFITGEHPQDFTVTSPPGQTTLSGSDFTEFEITFEPTAPGYRTALVYIVNNDANENPYRFMITGFADALDTPQLTVPGTVDVTPTVNLTWNLIGGAAVYNVDVINPEGAAIVDTAVPFTDCVDGVCTLPIETSSIPGNYTVSVQAEGETLVSEVASDSFRLIPGSTTLTAPSLGSSYTANQTLSFPAAAGAAFYVIDVYGPNSSYERYTPLAADVCTDGICAVEVSTSTDGYYDVYIVTGGGPEPTFGEWTYSRFSNGLIDVPLTSPTSGESIAPGPSVPLTFDQPVDAGYVVIDVYGPSSYTRYIAEVSTACTDGTCTYDLPIDYEPGVYGVWTIPGVGSDRFGIWDYNEFTVAFDAVTLTAPTGTVPYTDTLALTFAQPEGAGYIVVDVYWPNLGYNRFLLEPATCNAGICVQEIPSYGLAGEYGVWIIPGAAGFFGEWAFSGFTMQSAGIDTAQVDTLGSAQPNTPPLDTSQVEAPAEGPGD